MRDALQTLELPEAIQHQVAQGSVPLQTVKTLSQLTAIHPDLAIRAVAIVLEAPTQAWEEPTTWDQLIDDPIAVVAAVDEDDELPTGSMTPTAPTPSAASPSATRLPASCTSSARC